MNIRGTVTEARRKVPIVGAKVILAIGDREFAMSTNNVGRFEHREDANFAGETLTCTVEKEKFETAVVQRPIHSDIINLTIIMRLEKPVLSSPQPRRRGKNPIPPILGPLYSPISGGTDKLADVLKKHWAKILAGIVLLVMISVSVSTCSRPTIKTFSASSSNVKRGEKVKLTWETGEATLVTLNGVKVTLSGSTDMTPTETRPYSYELTAKNKYGGSRKDIIVAVIPAPAPTVKFRVEPQEVAKNEIAVLHWETSGATEVRLNHGKVGLSGHQEVKANATQTYTLVAQNEDGEKVESLTLKVIPAAGAPDSKLHLSFNATRNTIRPGEDTTLSWDSGTVKDVELIQGNQAPEIVPPRGEVKVSPTATTRYTLTGYPPTGPPIIRIVKIRVASVPAVLHGIDTRPQADADPSVTFSAQAESIPQGQGTQLIWKVENAKEVKFKADGESEKSLPFIGSMQVTPKLTTTYTLSAMGEKGPTATKTVTVRVTNDAAAFSTGGAAVEAEVVGIAGFTYNLRIRGKEYAVTADIHTNRDSNIGSGDSVTVRVDDGRVLEMKR